MSIVSSDVNEAPNNDPWLSSLSNFPFRQTPTASRIHRWKRRSLSSSLKSTLDRVNVLGSDSHGHTGCVNALSWARDGQLLLSGGDDTTVRIWSLDSSDTEQEYPFVCNSVIHTGHRANIFSAHMLPYSTRIATVAGDKQVRVFDIVNGGTSVSTSAEKHFNPRESCIRVFRCHEDRVKRIITEESPDLFLTVGEDGHVRQHDLRVAHSCGSGRAACPVPLIKINHELSALALSPLTPYQFVVAGEGPYGYLFDRRYVGRVLREEWGAVPKAAQDDVATCVRRFGRLPTDPGQRRRRRDHITGARMSTTNGHEVLLSFSGDAVHLYSTRDEPKSEEVLASSAILTPNSAKRRKTELPGDIPIIGGAEEPVDIEMLDDDIAERVAVDDFWNEMTGIAEDADNDYLTEEEEEYLQGSDLDMMSDHPRVPVILPRRSFYGACNVETVKDVNFLGPDEEYVVSGSDDGNFFIWSKATGVLQGIYEGDSSVVNVIEGHPHLPLVAVSGIDTTVKLFAPAHGPSAFSKMDQASMIMESNARNSAVRRLDITNLLVNHLIRTAAGNGDSAAIQGPQCTYQ